MKLNKIDHYNDDKLVWNDETGHYELSFQYAKTHYDIHFKDDLTLRHRLTRNSRKIYNVVYARVNTFNKKILDYVLNHTEEGRKWVFDLLSEQFYSDNETGYNDLSNMPAINFANGQVIDRRYLIENQISVDTEQILDRSANYFGFNVLYSAPLPYIKFED